MCLAQIKYEWIAVPLDEHESRQGKKPEFWQNITKLSKSSTLSIFIFKYLAKLNKKCWQHDYMCKRN